MQRNKTGLVRASRTASVLLLILILTGVGVAAFLLSFSALKGLAVMAHIPPGLAGLLPAVVDGTIVMATFGWLVLANHPERRWFLYVLTAGAAVSVAGNSLHAGMDGKSLPWWAAALVAAIAPISLLVDTHGLAVLVRVAQQDSTTNPDQTDDQAAGTAPPVAAPQRTQARSRKRDPRAVARAVRCCVPRASPTPRSPGRWVSARPRRRSTPPPPRPPRSSPRWSRWPMWSRCSRCCR